MMFLCLAYGTEDAWKALSKPEQDALLAQDEEGLRSRSGRVAADPTGPIGPRAATPGARDGFSCTIGRAAPAD